MMARELSDVGVDHSTPAPPTPLEEQVIVLLLDSLQKLADAGEVDAACRVAGKACVVLRQSNPKGEHRFNALLHRLTRRLEPMAADGMH